MKELYNRLKNHPLWYLVLSIPMLAFMKSGGFQGDVNCWIRWAVWIKEHGLGEVYQSGTDYVPLLHYILWFLNLFSEHVDQIGSKISRLRDIMVVCDGLIAVLIYYIGRKWGKLSREKSVIGSWIYLMLSGVLFNSLFWGQLEAMLSLLLLVSVLLALKNRPGWSLLFLLLALNFKVLTIVFIPLVALLNLKSIYQLGVKRVLLQIIVPLIMLELAILLPFWVAGNLDLIWKVVYTSAGRYPQASLNAPNFWTILYDEKSILIQSDSLRYGLTLKHWGMILFMISACFSMFPLLLQVIVDMGNSDSRVNTSPSLAFLTIGLTYGLFVFWNTEMHERYWHQLPIYIAAYAQFCGAYRWVVFSGLTYYLTLERVLKHTYHLNYEAVLVFNQRFLGILFLIILIWMYKEVYRLHRISKTKEEIVI